MNVCGASRRFAPKRRLHPSGRATASCTLALLLLPAAAALGGCGGGSAGGGGGASQASLSGSQMSTPYTPNYRAEVTALRHWEKGVVTVGFTPPPADSQGNVRNVLPLIQQAVGMWNAKVGGRVTYQIATGASADVVVSFVAPGTLPDGAIGRTEVTFRNADQVLISAVVRADYSLSDDLEAQVLTHELGHALGIEGHSQDNTDLMFARAHLPADITVRDQNTIDLAYSGGATITGSGSSAASAVLPPAARMARATPAPATTTTYVCAVLKPAR